MQPKDNKFLDSLNFVSQNYDSEAFSSSRTWDSLHISASAWWRRRGVAAAAACVVIMASAFVYTILETSHSDQSRDFSPAVPSQTEKVKVCRRIEFNDATLTEVVKEIEKVYSVEIENVPTKEIRLTLSYEGTAQNLVELINEMENISLKIKEKDRD